MTCEFCNSKAFSFYEPYKEMRITGAIGETITYIKREARCENCKAHYEILERWDYKSDVNDSVSTNTTG